MSVRCRCEDRNSSPQFSKIHRYTFCIHRVPYSPDILGERAQRRSPCDRNIFVVRSLLGVAGGPISARLARASGLNLSTWQPLRGDSQRCSLTPHPAVTQRWRSSRGQENVYMYPQQLRAVITLPNRSNPAILGVSWFEIAHFGSWVSQLGGHEVIC